jgi:hypothetical protein
LSGPYNLRGKFQAKKLKPSRLQRVTGAAQAWSGAMIDQCKVSKSFAPISAKNHSSVALK